MPTDSGSETQQPASVRRNRLGSLWLALTGRAGSAETIRDPAQQTGLLAAPSTVQIIEMVVAGLPGPAIMLDHDNRVVVFNSPASAIAPALRRGEPALITLRVPDLVVLDWMLPGLSGIELCRRLRARPETRQLPIIMLTARGEEREKVRGLATGADGYIVKPFSVPELLARVRALLRRASPDRVAAVLSIGDIELDREKKRVSRNGRAVDLGPTEYRLLEFLMERPGRVFSREQLLDGVWGSEMYIDERTVDVHVGRLRKALNRGQLADPIRTVRGAGYALDDRFGTLA